MLSNSTDTRGHAYVIQSGSLVQARAGRPARPRGGQCIANITREDKHRVPLSDNCTWAASTDLAAVSAPKRLQKQGHCEHQGGVRSTMVSLKITRVSNPKEVEKEKRKGRKKRGERSRKLFQAARGRREPRCPHTVDTKLPLPLRNKAQRCQSGRGQHRAGSPAPLTAPRDPPRMGGELHPATGLSLAPRARRGSSEAEGMEKVPGTDPGAWALRGFTIQA